MRNSPAADERTNLTGMLYFPLRDTSMKQEFNVIIERDSEGFYVGSVPELPGCHTQAKSLDRLMERIQEAIELCVEVRGRSKNGSTFVGVQRVAING